MQMTSIGRYCATRWNLAGLALFTLAGTAQVNADQMAFVQNGTAGFVVSHIQYALSHDAKDTGACPAGMTQGMQKPPDDAPEAEAKRFFSEAIAKNTCGNPAAAGPDPNFRIVTGPKVPVFGIDLDGKDSKLKGKPAPGKCSHEDFVGMNGERGIDNQFFRVVGCSNSFQPTGLSNSWSTEMLTGAWGILITVSGIDDIRNDDSVEVGFFANADPIELSSTRVPLANATYAIDQDPRFQAKTHGRIINGVLTTDPVNVRFHKVTNSIYVDRPLNDARVQLTIGEDGSLEGYLAGYTPVEEMYDLQYGFRSGKNAKGEPANPKAIAHTANGQAATLGHSCNGAYHALYAMADGDRDPATGKCTSISTQYSIKAIPAFVVNAQTKSLNEDLKGK